MGVSCFFMAVGLDEGETLVQKEFAPVRGVDIDNIFDPWMRAQALVAAVKHYVVRLLSVATYMFTGQQNLHCCPSSRRR